MTYSRFCPKTFFSIETQKGPAYTFFCRQHLFILPAFSFFGENHCTSLFYHTEFFFFLKLIIRTIQTQKERGEGEENGSTYRHLPKHIKIAGTDPGTSPFLYIPLSKINRMGTKSPEVLPTLSQEVLPTLLGSLSTQKRVFYLKKYTNDLGVIFQHSSWFLFFFSFYFCKICNIIIFICF